MENNTESCCISLMTVISTSFMISLGTCFAVALLAVLKIERTLSYRTL